MDRALVGVPGLRMRRALPDLAPVAQMPQNPRAEPAGRLAQLCLPGLGLVLVAEPNPSWATSPLSSHAVPVYPANDAHFGPSGGAMAGHSAGCPCIVVGLRLACGQHPRFGWGHGCMVHHKGRV
jgi:hypothetical protein